MQGHARTWHKSCDRSQLLHVMANIMGLPSGQVAYTRHNGMHADDSASPWIPVKQILQVSSMLSPADYGGSSWEEHATDLLWL